MKIATVNLRIALIIDTKKEVDIRKNQEIFIEIKTTQGAIEKKEIVQEIAIIEVTQDMKDKIIEAKEMEAYGNINSLTENDQAENMNVFLIGKIVNHILIKGKGNLKFKINFQSVN